MDEAVKKIENQNLLCFSFGKSEFVPFWTVAAKSGSWLPTNRLTELRFISFVAHLCIISMLLISLLFRKNHFLQISIFFSSRFIYYGPHPRCCSYCSFHVTDTNLPLWAFAKILKSQRYWSRLKNVEKPIKAIQQEPGVSILTSSPVR